MEDTTNDVFEKLMNEMKKEFEQFKTDMRAGPSKRPVDQTKS